MNYLFALHTDVGIKKKTNQDSLCVKEASTPNGNILMALVCDGMGGLEKGEVASATIIKAFSKWFQEELPYDLSKRDIEGEIRYKWDRIIKQQNQIIGEYGRKNHIQLGSTITVILFLHTGTYIIGHVGDSRAYRITEQNIEVLTEDQTVVANEVKKGRMTLEQAEQDPRRNVLLQCVGASRIVEPVFITGKAEKDDCFMLCSDGFRHVVSQEEIYSAFLPSLQKNEEMMKENIVRLIDLNKTREETDNISSILIKLV